MHRPRHRAKDDISGGLRFNCNAGRRLTEHGTDTVSNFVEQ